MTINSNRVPASLYHQQSRWQPRKVQTRLWHSNIAAHVRNDFNLLVRTRGPFQASQCFRNDQEQSLQIPLSIFNKQRVRNDVKLWAPARYKNTSTSLHPKRLKIKRTDSRKQHICHYIREEVELSEFYRGLYAKRPEWHWTTSTKVAHPRRR